VLTDTVTINYSIDLRLVADIVDAPVDELEALNPSLLRMATPPDQTFDLHLPAGTATLYEQRVATVPESRRVAWRYHRVAADDTLASVAHQFHVTEAALADANQLNDGAGLQGVEALAIPLAPVVAPSHMLLYVTRRGDTLVTIADRFGVSLTDLRRWNKMAGIKVEPGRRLHIAEPSGAARSTRSPRAGAAAPASENAPQAAPAKGSAHRPASTAGSRAATAAAKKSAPAPPANAHTGKAHSSPSAGKGAAPSTKKKRRSKQPSSQK
jgi:membrane-bound lytic murein transglycosylase D